jgi:hypothetical protein
MMDLWIDGVMALENSNDPLIQYSNIPEQSDNA